MGLDGEMLEQGYRVESKKKQLHYHVLGGLHGCMPNLNVVYDNLEDAQQGLKGERKTEIDNGTSPFGISGSYEDGYYEVKNGGNEYYEITECYEGDCLEEVANG